MFVFLWSFVSSTVSSLPGVCISWWRLLIRTWPCQHTSLLGSWVYQSAVSLLLQMPYQAWRDQPYFETGNKMPFKIFQNWICTNYICVLILQCLQNRSKVSWQSLEPRSPRLDPRKFRVSSLKSRGSSIESKIIWSCPGQCVVPEKMYTFSQA